MTFVPSRGDAIWLDFDPQAGTEQAGRRPALVLSQAAYNRRVGLALVYPITSQVKGYPFEVPLPAKLRVRGAVLADQKRSLDWRARKATRTGPVPAGVIEQVLAKAAALLDPEEA